MLISPISSLHIALSAFLPEKINIPPTENKKWVKPLTKEARAVSESESQFAQRPAHLSRVCNGAIFSVKDDCLMQITCWGSTWGSTAAPWELYLAQAVGGTLCAIPCLRTSPNQEEQGYKAKMTNKKASMTLKNLQTQNVLTKQGEGTEDVGSKSLGDDCSNVDQRGLFLSSC